MKKKKYLAIFMAMSMATATAPVTALADDAANIPATGSTENDAANEATANEWTSFIDGTDLGHTTVPGSDLKYSEVPEIHKAMADGYSAIWASKTDEARAEALATAKANLLTATKNYVQFLLDTAKDITVNDIVYTISEENYNTAKDAIANAETCAEVLGAYNTALGTQESYDAQPLADQWTAFIEETDLGHTTVPGSNLKYSEVPEIQKAMAGGYSAIWDAKTNAAGATALETAKANLLTTTKNYVQFLLDTAKDITVGDVTYRIPADVYNTAKDAIANATTVADVLSAYNTALEAQVEVTPVTGVSVTPAQATIRVGNTTTIKAIVTPDDATEKAVTWTSSDDTVATVDSNGVVTGVKVGTATITATTIDGSFAATCEVNVNRKHSSSSSSSGGGGGSSVAKYGVTISDSKNGAVTASAAKAETGDKVILTPKADEGYVLDKITAKDKDGKEVKLKAEKDGTYSFTMPKGGVTVDTTFKQAQGAASTDKPAAATKTIILQIGSTAVLVDDQAIINDVAPVIRNDRTLVPIRVITEALGGQVAWNEAAKEVTLTVNGKEIKMTIGKALEKYGVAPVIIGGRTFVPVRFVADELGAVTTWDDATKTVTIQAVK